MAFITGNRGAGYATIETAGATPTFGTPVAMPGLISASIETEQSSDKKYADNVAVITLMGKKIKSAKVAFFSVPEAFAEYALGMKRATNGMVTDTGINKAFCFFFLTDEIDAATGESTPTIHYLYNAKAGEPAQETETNSDEVNVAEFELELECAESSFVVDADGVGVQYGYLTRTNLNADIFDARMTEIILPDTPLA